MSTEHLNTENTSTESSEINESMLSFVELNEKDKNKADTAKPRRIRRRTLNLILTSAGTVLVAIILLVVMLLDKHAPTTGGGDTTPSDTTVETPKITLLNKAGDEETKGTPMKQIDIQNKDGSYTIRYDDTTKLYHIVGYEDIYLDTEMLLTLRTHAETIEAIEQIQDASNLAAFGLDAPQATATITYTDDSTARLFLGNTTPSENGYYGQLEGTDGVYIFESDTVSLFRFRSTAFVHTALSAPPSVKPDDKNGKSLLKEVTFSGTAHPIPLVMRRSYYNDSEELTYFSYIITAPYTRCTTDAVSNSLSQVQAIMADQALILHPTAADKEKMGFNNPLIDIKFTMAVETEEESESTPNDSTGSSAVDKNDTPKIYYNSIDYHIIVGSVDENGNYIAMVDGIDVIFLVSKESYGFFLDRTYQNSVNDFLFFKSIEDLGSVSFKLNNSSYTFNLEHYPEKEEPDDKLKVTMDNKTYSTEDFRELYQLLMGLKRYGTPEKEPTSEVPLEIALYDAEGELYLGAKYYNTSGSLCTVETSEGELFTTRWSDVAFFIQQVDNYLNGRNVLLST
ncbi:MAG: DUF4340 domain-containing protein [Clostridia bacterium]|nr:DUF4340 domain-containing protein [Clostridia bacterium]